VGVYQSVLDDFLDKLTRHRVAILLDVRQRRGVRGREYAWANSRRLQATLKQAGIEYWHLPELAPTEEYRRRYLHRCSTRSTCERSSNRYLTRRRPRCCASNATPGPVTVR
jgi:uncharacterized protein (DUF488 family)